MDLKFYIFFALVILFQYVETLPAENESNSNIVMTQKEVLLLDLKEFNNENKCPKYSKKGSTLNYACTYTFYCKDDKNCQPDTYDSPYFKYKTESGEIKNLIKKVCPASDSLYDEKVDCTTEKCNDDSDCLSNYCHEGVCIDNGSSPFTECSDVNVIDDFDKPYQAMACGKFVGEQCRSEYDCAGSCKTGHCISHTTKINYKKPENYPFILNVIFTIIAIVIMIGGIGLFIYCLPKILPCLCCIFALSAMEK